MGIIVPGPPMPLIALHIICIYTVFSYPRYLGSPTIPFERAIIIRPINTINLLFTRDDNQLTKGHEIAYESELTPII